MKHGRGGNILKMSTLLIKVSIKLQMSVVLLLEVYIRNILKKMVSKNNLFLKGNDIIMP